MTRMDSAANISVATAEEGNTDQADDLETKLTRREVTARARAVKRALETRSQQNQAELDRAATADDADMSFGIKSSSLDNIDHETINHIVYNRYRSKSDRVMCANTTLHHD